MSSLLTKHNYVNLQPTLSFYGICLVVLTVDDYKLCLLKRQRILPFHTKTLNAWHNSMTLNILDSKQRNYQLRWYCRFQPVQILSLNLKKVMCHYIISTQNFFKTPYKYKGVRLFYLDTHFAFSGAQILEKGE